MAEQQPKIQQKLQIIFDYFGISVIMLQTIREKNKILTKLTNEKRGVTWKFIKLN